MILMLTIHSFYAGARNDQFFIDTFNAYVPVDGWFNQELAVLGDIFTSGVLEPRKQQFEYDRPLFDAYPRLKDSIAHCSFAQLPTSIEELRALADELHIQNLYIKQDSMTGTIVGSTRLFGGNKARKLEFLLAQALQKGATAVMTFGAAGSNHVLATATYAREVGLEAIALLKPQPKKYAVQRNLLLDVATGAQLCYYPSHALRNFGAQHAFLWHKMHHGDFPYVIPTGGSCPIGALGFVNAAFEIKHQIQSGQMPMPDSIVVPSGSYGTAAGLLLGCALAAIPSQICAVAIAPEEEPGSYHARIQLLFEETNQLLHDADHDIPLAVFPEEQLQLITDCSGTGYGIPTDEALEAIELLDKKHAIKLDSTYSGKGFAYIVHAACEGKLHNKTVLFWNTYSEYTPEMQRIIDEWNYQRLPRPLHTYFE